MTFAKLTITLILIIKSKYKQKYLNKTQLNNFQKYLQNLLKHWEGTNAPSPLP